MANLSQQDAVAPGFRVRHVRSTEDHLYIKWTSRAGATMAIPRAEFGKARATRQTTGHPSGGQPGPPQGG